MALTEFQKKLEGVLVLSPIVKKDNQKKLILEAEIKKLKERIAELEKKPTTQDQGTSTNLSNKNINLLIEQWEEVAKWAKEEGIDVNQKWNIKTLQKILLDKFHTVKNQAAETQKKQEQQIINLSEEVKKILEKDEVIKKLEKRNQDLESILETHTKLLDEKSNKIKELEQKPSLDVREIINRFWKAEERAGTISKSYFEGDEKSRKKTQEEVKSWLDKIFQEENTEKKIVEWLFSLFVKTYYESAENKKFMTVIYRDNQNLEGAIKKLETEIEELKADREREREREWKETIEGIF